MKLLSIKVAGIVAVSMLAGCASTSDVEGIQTQIDSLKILLSIFIFISIL